MSRYTNAASDYLPEKDFLIKFAVDSYNKKYKRNLNRAYCHIKSVEKAYGYVYGYQIETIRSDDHVVIMLYFNLGDITRDHIVRAETIQNVEINNALGDEVYVVTGEVARFYKEHGVYKFKWIKSDGFNYTAIMFTDADIIQFMDDDYLAFMSDTPSPPFPA